MEDVFELTKDKLDRAQQHANTQGLLPQPIAIQAMLSVTTSPIRMLVLSSEFFKHYQQHHPILVADRGNDGYHGKATDSQSQDQVKPQVDVLRLKSKPQLLSADAARG